MESIKCDVCESAFNDCFSFETNQALGCASDLFVEKKQTYILSHYGSRFDTTRFFVSPQSSLQDRQGIVCDNCIEQLINEKQIQEDQNFDFWAPYKQLNELYRPSKDTLILDSIFPEEIGKTYEELEKLNEQGHKY